jgi:hypothetical protein
MVQAQISTTNPSVTPEDRIEAAIGRLATTLTTGVPPQLRNDMVDKLCKLHEILEPRTDGNDECEITAPMQQVPIAAITKTGRKQQP